MEENKVSNKGTRKTVYFGDGEDKILEYALKQSKNFASYVKRLIEEDMKKEKEPLEKTIKKIVEDYLNNKQITISTTEMQKEIKFEQEDINALNKLMRRD